MYFNSSYRQRKQLCISASRHGKELFIYAIVIYFLIAAASGGDDFQSLAWFHADLSPREIASLTKGVKAPEKIRFKGFSSGFCNLAAESNVLHEREIELEVESADPSAVALMGSLCLRNQLSVILYRTDSASGKAKVSSKKDWLLVFGEPDDFKNEKDCRQMIENVIGSNLEAVLSGNVDETLRTYLPAILRELDVAQERIPGICSSFESLLFAQSVDLAKNIKLDVAPYLERVSKNSRLASDPKVIEAQTQYFGQSDNIEDFSKLIMALNASEISLKESNAIANKLRTLIVDADSVDLVHEYAIQALESKNVSVVKEILRKLAEHPIAPLMPECLRLARSDDPMVAYHAMRVLSEYGYPKIPKLPDAQSYKKNVDQYRAEWNRFLDELQIQ